VPASEPTDEWNSLQGQQQLVMSLPLGWCSCFSGVARSLRSSSSWRTNSIVYRLPTATLLVTQVRDTCRRAVSFVIGRLHLFAPGAFNITPSHNYNKYISIKSFITVK